MTTTSKTYVLYQQVREKIVCGDIKPGEILTEAGLADEYGVSKAPVREALVLLGHEGLVESMPRIGHVVATFTVQDVLETFHLRSVLEAEAAGLAAERITEEGIAALLKIVDEESALSERAQEGDFDERAFDERAYGLNTEFHHLIARASGNRRLADLIKKDAYQRFYMHRTGHWLGMYVHDVGDYKVDGHWRELEPGMVLTVEPGLYIPLGAKGVAKKWQGIGIRIEDDVLVTRGDPDVLSRDAPKTIDEIEAIMAS